MDPLAMTENLEAVIYPINSTEKSGTLFKILVKKLPQSIFWRSRDREVDRPALFYVFQDKGSVTLSNDF